MPKAFTTQEKDWIAQKLLEQGEAQFSAHGLQKTSVEELAQAAGISKAAFYLFYPSKEALFMEVVERAEQRFRLEVLAEIERPGPTPRRRLAAIFHKAFALWREMPLLRFITSADFGRLTRRVPIETIQEHLASDRQFIFELVQRSQAAGIPITAHPEDLASLMYALFFTALHENDLGPGALAGAMDTLVELISAYCLGEIKT